MVFQPFFDILVLRKRVLNNFSIWPYKCPCFNILRHARNNGNGFKQVIKRSVFLSGPSYDREQTHTPVIFALKLMKIGNIRIQALQV